MIEVLRRFLIKARGISTAHDIFGVVHPSGVSGAQSRGETTCALRFSLHRWRQAGAAVEQTELSVQRKVTAEELTELQDHLRPYDVVHLRGRIVSPSPPVAELIDVLGTDADDQELRADARRLQEPVTVDVPLLGRLTLDRSVDWREGTADWNGHRIAVRVVPEDTKDLEPALQTAKSLWSDQVIWDPRIRDFAVRKRLPLKNESWLDEGGPIA